MHTPKPRQPSRLPRAAALFIALLGLWMATVGVVGHTDTLRCGPSSSPTTVWTHKLAAVPADACAACQWLTGLQSTSLTTAALTLPYRYTPFAYPAPATRAHGHARLQTSTRAPPVRQLSPDALS